jgi:LPS O-antigen subunit length determinant protein (WzzB/FepE family)
MFRTFLLVIITMTMTMTMFLTFLLVITIAMMMVIFLMLKMIKNQPWTSDTGVSRYDIRHIAATQSSDTILHPTLLLSVDDKNDPPWSPEADTAWSTETAKTRRKRLN